MKKHRTDFEEQTRQESGFASVHPKAEAAFNECINEVMAECVAVAVLSADNDNRNVLTEKDMEAVKRVVKVIK